MTASGPAPAQGSRGRPLRVLIIEDEPAHAELEVRALSQAGFAVYSKVVDSEATYLAALSADLDIIISDNSLPRFNALKAADALHERGLDVPIIVVSGTIGEETAVELLKRGIADYLLKDRLARLGAAVERALDERRLRLEKMRADRELREAYDTTIAGWSRALDLRDKETEGHSERVTALTLQMARAMRLPEADLVHVRRGALLHDIGKMGIPDSILLKPGPLTLDEWALMRRHPDFAHQLLAPIAYLQPALDIPYCHHERWDGTGYPRGLKETEIPLAARIFALADMWDALRSNRPYRRAFRKEQAIVHIREQSGRQFDPGLIDLFLELVADEPKSADGS
jgi:putative two-component system response regulator